MAPLDGLRVVELSSEIAGPYCTKLLADAGADVVKVEPAAGDPMRRWTACGIDPGDRDSALFRFLNASKRSVVGVPGDAWVDDLVARADIVVEDLPLGVFDVAAAHRRAPALTVVSITPFGTGGPWDGRPATEFTLQGWCGSIGRRGRPDGPPLAAGGRVGEWIGGTYGAVAALAGWRGARRSGRGARLEVSLLECMTITLDPFTWLHASYIGGPPVGTSRRVEVPSVARTADGFVGFTTTTAQQFRDFLLLIERPDLAEDKEIITAAGRSRRMDEMVGYIEAWTGVRTTEECIEAATLLRIPVTPVGDGRTVVDFDHFRQRGVFVDGPDGDFVQPRVPYRISGAGPRPFEPAPRLGADDGRVEWGPRPQPEAGDVVAPLVGLRVLDFTAFWAGPAATHVLVALGAEVIKVESIQRADGMRFTSAKGPATDRWWEWGWINHAVNPAKRDVTLDLSRPEGIELVERLIARADVVVENFSPRVMEHFGLDWDRVSALQPGVVMVRMPAFGLDGPWRDRTGFAQTMEMTSGMAAVTGWQDGPPMIPGGLCDPLAGMHAVVALLLALDEQARTGEGRLVEVTTVEAALNVAATAVVELGAYGELLGRHGNRGPAAAPQGIYPCAGDDEWLALAVATDDQWAALGAVLRADGGLAAAAWAAAPDLADPAGRRRAHDLIDDHIGAWCASADASELAERLMEAGVPAARVTIPVKVPDNPQLQARGFFEVRHHPVAGTHGYPAIPFTWSPRPRPWLVQPAPTLGQDNVSVLGGDLGLDEARLAALRHAEVIGERPSGL